MLRTLVFRRQIFDSKSDSINEGQIQKMLFKNHSEVLKMEVCLLAAKIIESGIELR